MGIQGTIQRASQEAHAPQHTTSKPQEYQCLFRTLLLI